MQVLPQDVDYRVMVTFVEFYQTLLQFVNFKLYHIIGVTYPPVVDPKMEKAAAGLASIMQELCEFQTKQPLQKGEFWIPVTYSYFALLRFLYDVSMF